MDGNIVVVTGIAGYLGQVLLPHLVEDESVQRIVGIDQAHPHRHADSAKLEMHLFDVRAPEIANLIEGADALIHMAFRLWRFPGNDDVDQINIDGSEHVLRSAARLGIPKIIFTSSVVGYGLHPDNPIPLTEESPLHPNTDLYYSKAKAQVEKVIAELRDEYPDTIFTVLRPCTVVGPSADPDQMELVTSKTTLLVRGYEPPGQLVHEQDVASAIMLALKKDLPGVYNVAGDGPVTRVELLQGREGARVIRLPYWLARSLFAILWRTGMSMFAPEWVDLLRYPLVCSTEKLKREGWEPQYTTLEAYQDLLRSVGEMDEPTEGKAME